MSQGNRTDVMDVEKPNGVTHLSFYFRSSYSTVSLYNFTFALDFDEYDPEVHSVMFLDVKVSVPLLLKS